MKESDFMIFSDYPNIKYNSTISSSSIIGRIQYGLLNLPFSFEQIDEKLKELVDLEIIESPKIKGEYKITMKGYKLYKTLRKEAKLD